MNFFLYIALGLSLSALVYAFYLYKQVLKAPVGSKRVAEISGFIKEGANAFLKKEYFVILIFILLDNCSTYFKYVFALEV